MIFNIKLVGKKILFAGGGHIAEFKIKKFLKESPKIYVIAPSFTDYIRNLGTDSTINIIQREIAISDITGEYFLVISATDNPLINKQISIACERLGILHDDLSNHLNSDTMMVANTEFNNLTISISTAGNDPKTSKRLKTELEGDLNSGSNNFEEDIKTIYNKKM